MSSRQYFVPKKSLQKKFLSAEEKEKRMLQRIFDHITRRKRTPFSYRRNTRNGATRSSYAVQEDKDVILKKILSNVPRKKRTTDYEYVPPKAPPQARPKDPQASPKPKKASPNPLQASPKPPKASPKPPQASLKPPKVPKPSSRPRKIITPEWLIQVMRGMDGAGDPKLIISEKTLDVNDVDSNKNRLSIPINSVIQKDFLTLEESRIIDDDDITNKEGNMGVGAVLVDQRTIQWTVGFKQWFMTTKPGRSYWSFVLRGEWSDVVRANGLKAGDKISLWSFRCRRILFFALVPPTSSTVLGS